MSPSLCTMSVVFWDLLSRFMAVILAYSNEVEAAGCFSWHLLCYIWQSGGWSWKSILYCSVTHKLKYFWPTKHHLKNREYSREIIAKSYLQLAQAHAQLKVYVHQNLASLVSLDDCFQGWNQTDHEISLKFVERRYFRIISFDQFMKNKFSSRH